MILSKLEHCSKYLNLHPLFSKGVDFIKNKKLSQLPNGKIEIVDNDLFILISKPGTSLIEIPKLEAHKKYIDIHYIIEGTEEFGWKDLAICQNVEGEFDVEKDYILYNDQDFATLLLQKDSFVIVYPEDAHAPLIKTEKLHKLVLKIKL